MRAEKIYLIGFMAAGKSSLARALAERLKWHVEDIDDRIEVREHKTISELFSQRGESYFRMVERAILTEMLPLNHTVIATGGGTFVDPDNQAAINGNGASIWNDVPWPVLVPNWSSCTPYANPPTLRHIFDSMGPERPLESWPIEW